MAGNVIDHLMARKTPGITSATKPRPMAIDITK
jgi:hypothetical protein